MEVNEATQILKASDDEIKAVQRYFGFEHTSINLLGNLNPSDFCELDRKGWLFAKDREELQDKIKTFVDIYSLMYKDSIESKGIRLVRGTSREKVRKIRGSTKQFLSTSMDANVSKRFCEYGSAALVRVRIGDGVPHLYSEKYIDSVVNEDEKEVIIAPFCKVTNNSLVKKDDEFEYYEVSIEKGELQEKTEEEIEGLTTEVLDGYEQNIIDMKEYVRLSEKRTSLSEKLPRAIDKADRLDILEELRNVEDECYAVMQRTKQYNENLTGLLQGMCKNKEKEIDEAREVIEKDTVQKRKVLEEQSKEAKRKYAIDELSSKLSGAAQKTGRINQNIVKAYNKMLDNETNCRRFAAELGIPFDSSIQELLGKDVADVTALVSAVGKQMGQTQISEGNTLEETQAQNQQYKERLGKIDASVEIADALEEVSRLYGVQATDSLKKNIYLHMNDLMKIAKIKLLQEQRDNIEGQKKGIFDGITGKAKLRELQLKNIDLRMQLVSESVPEEKGYYSIKDMLAEMYTFSQTELGGQYTPDLGKLFTTVQSKFGINGTSFTLEQIKKLAIPKLQQHRSENLPVVPSKGFKLFKDTKDKITNLETQNSQVQTQLNNVDRSNFSKEVSKQVNPQEKPAARLLKERLMDIVHNIDNEPGPTRTQAKTKADDTLKLWI